MGLFRNFKKNYDKAPFIIDGDKYFKDCEYDKALNCADNGLKIDSKDSRLWNNKGLALMNLKESQ